MSIYKWKIGQIFVAFSEYLNFDEKIINKFHHKFYFFFSDTSRAASTCNSHNSSNFNFKTYNGPRGICKSKFVSSYWRRYVGSQWVVNPKGLCGCTSKEISLLAWPQLWNFEDKGQISFTLKHVVKNWASFTKCFKNWSFNDISWTKKFS